MSSYTNSKDPLTLPTEITAEVFKHTVSVDIDTLSQRAVAEGLTTPLTLAAVSRSWRNFVCDAPFLWRFIVMNISKRRYRSQLNILDMWLIQSDTSPLDIWFNVMNHLSPGSADVENAKWHTNPPLAAIQLLMNHSERWEKINLCVVCDISFQFIDALQRIKGRIPLLRAAHLRPMENGGIARKELDMFNNAPLLESFAISVFSVEGFTLPWRQLSSFRARLPSKECLIVLTQCVNLEECTFYAIFDDSDSISSTDSPNIINMPRLRSLCITNTEGHLIKIIIQRITCPALTHIRLAISVDITSPYRMDLPFYGIENLITRSHCVLETLDLQSDSIPSFNQVFGILEETPDLRKLTFRTEMKSFSDTFFDALIERLDPSTYPAFLPHLTHTRYSSPSPIRELTYNLLANAIRQRQRPADGISKLLELIVEVTNESQNIPVISDDLEELADRGTRIRIQGLSL